MKVEVLYFAGCPNHEELVPRLEALLREHGSPVVELVEVPDDEAAQRERFLGSPTLRIDGLDVEPAAQTRIDFGLKCRLYRTPQGLSGTPLDAWILAALGHGAGLHGRLRPDQADRVGQALEAVAADDQRVPNATFAQLREHARRPLRALPA